MKQMEAFLAAARAAYEEAKINFNTGKCTAAHLEGVRLALERLERAASALPAVREGEA